MAIFRPSSAVAAISGRLGSTVFTAGKSRPTFRSRPSVVRTATSLQLLRRAEFSSLSLKWQTLTDDERTQWREAILQIPTINHLGLLRPLSGYNYFLFENRNAVVAGVTLRTTPPELHVTAPMTSIELGVVKVGSPTWNAAFTGGPDVNHLVEIWSARSYVARELRSLPRWRLQERSPGTVTHVAKLRDPFVDTWGDPQEAETIIFRFRFTAGPPYTLTSLLPSPIFEAGTRVLP
jgi:hypothetical protein